MRACGVTCRALKPLYTATKGRHPTLRDILKLARRCEATVERRSITGLDMLLECIDVLVASLPARDMREAYCALMGMSRRD